MEESEKWINIKGEWYKKESITKVCHRRCDNVSHEEFDYLVIVADGVETTYQVSDEQSAEKAVIDIMRKIGSDSVIAYDTKSQVLDFLMKLKEHNDPSKDPVFSRTSLDAHINTHIRNLTND
jgi:hypothetical protein